MKFVCNLFNFVAFASLEMRQGCEFLWGDLLRCPFSCKSCFINWFYFHKICRMGSREDKSISDLKEEIFHKFRDFMTGYLLSVLCFSFLYFWQVPEIIGKYLVVLFVYWVNRLYACICCPFKTENFLGILILKGWGPSHWECFFLGSHECHLTRIIVFHGVSEGGLDQ